MLPQHIKSVIPSKDLPFYGFMGSSLGSDKRYGELVRIYTHLVELVRLADLTRRMSHYLYHLFFLICGMNDPAASHGVSKND